MEGPLGRPREIATATTSIPAKNLTHPPQTCGHLRHLGGSMAASSSSSVTGYRRVGHSATRPVAGVYPNRGRRPSLAGITAHSYRSATDSLP
jgi:hypothetical protein